MADFSKVLSFLRRQGVEVSAEAEAAAKKEFDGQVLVPSDKVLADGMIAIAKEFNDSKTEDLKVLKEKLRKSEAESAELKQVLESGESTNKKKLEKLLSENERLKGLADAHLSEKKQLWKDMAEKIPDQMKKFFAFAAEGKELSDEEIMQNVSKLSEYISIGAIQTDGAIKKGAPGMPITAPGGGPPRKDKKAWEDLPASEKIKAGYREAAKKAGE